MKIHIPEFRAMAKCNQHLDHGPIDIDLGPDVVRVVRCRDCRSYNKPKTGWCEAHLDCEHPDDYCSYGKRKDGAEC